MPQSRRASVNDKERNREKTVAIIIHSFNQKNKSSYSDCLNFDLSKFSFLFSQMVASSRMTDQKKATPPPPPPRGVTLRSTSAVAAAISAHNGGAGVGAHHRNNKYKENQPSSSAQAEPSHRHLTAAPVGGTAHQPGTTGYLETRYAYSVNGILGSAAQASAAAAFFARYFIFLYFRTNEKKNAPFLNIFLLFSFFKHEPSHYVQLKWSVTVNDKRLLFPI